MLKKLLSIILLSCFLSACLLPVVFVAGAGIGGSIVYDKRNMKTMVQDRDMATAALHKIQDDPDLSEHAHISIATFNHIILLAGQAPTEELRQRAFDLVNSVPNVKRIYNEVTVEPPTSTMIRTNDSWITTKVKSAMLAEKGLRSSQIKVVTENSVVYLMGIVTRKQSDLAAQAASRVSGVKKVVKIFEYEQ